MLRLEQWEDEHFHEYFSRFLQVVQEHDAWGYQYHKFELCKCIVEGMNPATFDLAMYMSKGRLWDMGSDECWDFFCFMSDECMQVESPPIPQPDETSYAYLESLVEDLANKVNSLVVEHCERCDSSLHSTTTCPFYEYEKAGGITLESNDHELDVPNEDIIVMDEPLELNELDGSRGDEMESSDALKEMGDLCEDERFSYYELEDERFFDDGLEDDERNEQDSVIEVCPSPMEPPSMLSTWESPLSILDAPCKFFPNFSPFVIQDVHDEKPCLEPKVESRVYYEVAFEESAQKSFDPYYIYLEKPPPEQNWFQHIPSHESSASLFDRLKRFLNAILFIFKPSLGYLHLCEMCSQSFDRLLRALTMIDLSI